MSKERTTISLATGTGFGFGVFWFVWGYYGIWWGILYGIFWIPWLGYRFAQWMFS